MANISDAKRLHGLRRKLKRELEDLELAGLDERASTVREEIRQVGAKIKKIKQEHRREKNERRRRDRKAKERHEAAQKEYEAERKRRREVVEWFRSWSRFRGGPPVPAELALEAAEDAGHDPDALEAATTSLKRRSDGTICLGFRGEGYLRRDYVPVERRRDAVGA